MTFITRREFLLACLFLCLIGAFSVYSHFAALNRMDALEDRLSRIPQAQTTAFNFHHSDYVYLQTTDKGFTAQVKEKEPESEKKKEGKK